MLKVNRYLGNKSKEVTLVKNIKKWLLYRPSGWRKNRAESITNLTIRIDRNLTVYVNMVFSDNLNANFSYNSVQTFQSKFLEWFSINTDVPFTFLSPMSDNFVYNKVLGMAKLHAIARHSIKKEYKNTYFNDWKVFSDIHDFKTDTNKLKKWLLD